MRSTVVVSVPGPPTHQASVPSFGITGGGLPSDAHEFVEEMRLNKYEFQMYVRCT